MSVVLLAFSSHSHGNQSDHAVTRAAAALYQLLQALQDDALAASQLMCQRHGSGHAKVGGWRLAASKSIPDIAISSSIQCLAPAHG